jgi:hypothetical protein
MSLAIEVGPLAWCFANGEQEGAEWTQRDIREINRILAANGLPAHIEPLALPRLDDRCRLRGMPYSWLHYLRRAYAYARQAPAKFTPLAEGADTSDDARLDREESLLRSHLVCHSDTDGYYVPVDFAEPLVDETDVLVGGVLGSSQGAMRELVLVAPLLNIRLRNGALSNAIAKTIANEDGGQLYIERQVWLQLFEAFRLSIEHGAVVKFC